LKLVGPTVGSALVYAAVADFSNYRMLTSARLVSNSAVEGFQTNLSGGTVIYLDYYAGGAAWRLHDSDTVRASWSPTLDTSKFYYLDDRVISGNVRNVYFDGVLRLSSTHGVNPAITAVGLSAEGVATVWYDYIAFGNWVVNGPVISYWGAEEDGGVSRGYKKAWRML
jgi:hypothetical protein